MKDRRLLTHPLTFFCALMLGGCASSHADKPMTVSRGASSQSGDAIAANDPGKSGSERPSAQPVSPPDEDGAREVVEENYPSGALWKRTEGKRGADGQLIPDGVTTTWYESGFKWSETTFRNGIKDGPRRTWYTTGAEWSNGSYSNGIEDGTWTAYHPTGEMARQWHIDHGMWQGAYTEWHPNGRKRMEVTFVDGIRQGVMSLHDENGVLIGTTDFIDGVEQP